MKCLYCIKQGTNYIEKYKIELCDFHYREFIQRENPKLWTDRFKPHKPFLQVLKERGEV